MTNSISNSDQGRQADESILATIPTPDEIREAMNRNAEENRVLRALYRISRRLADRNFAGQIASEYSPH